MKMIIRPIVFTPFLFTILLSTLGQAKECRSFLDPSGLESSEAYLLQSGQLFKIEEDVRLDERRSLDHSLIQAISDLTREDLEGLKQLDQIEFKILRDIFRRFKPDQYAPKLTKPQLIAMAYVEFSILDNLSRAEVALGIINQIPAPIQYRHKRILMAKVEFLDANGDIDSADRILDIILLRGQK